MDIVSGGDCAIAFLAAPAHGFVTGQTLFVCGAGSVAGLRV